MTAIKMIPTLLTLFVALCTQSFATEKSADTIYFGGPIVTMIRDGDRVEAVAVAEGKILATGSKDDVMALKGAETNLVDLGGKCLMPGFIDPHSHVVLQSLKFAGVNLDPHPIGDVKSIADIQRKLREHIEKKKPKPGAWIIGWGYDDTAMEEMRHPNRDDLDKVSTEHPIFLFHISMHLAAVNSKTLELARVGADTPDPEGGRIQRKPGSREPNGVFEENAMKMMLANFPTPSQDKLIAILEAGLDFYVAAGITTAQEGASFPTATGLLRKMDDAGKMPIDVVAYPATSLGADKEAVLDISETWKEMKRFRLGGIKLVLDGSLQGYTGYLSKPYHVPPENGQSIEDSCESGAVEEMFFGDSGQEETHVEEPTGEKDYRGYPSMTLEQVRQWIRTCDDAGIQILAHTNGDAATDLLIDAIKAERKDWPRPDLRTVIIHAQTMREDQLDFSATHGLVPSFFPIHVVYWGDRHRDIFLGPKRAARINPARSALDRGMKMTIHHDAPVAGISMLNVVDAAVNRITSSGKLLGAEQRITPYEALRAVTKDAAWQYFEEHRKGTIEAGKLADFVILDKDPLAVDSETIKDIRVFETIKEGATIYTRSE